MTLRANRFLPFLLSLYAIIWIALAVAPRDRAAWVLENLLVVLFVGALAFTFRRFTLSNRSYFLIATFLTLHAVGAHYTYAQTPFGEWLREAFDLSRNHFDRMIHFSFGLLMAYPVREVLLRVVGEAIAEAEIIGFGADRVKQIEISLPAPRLPCEHRADNRIVAAASKLERLRKAAEPVATIIFACREL